MDHPVVSHEEWMAARRALPEREKASLQGDELNRLVRELPWEAVAKEYAFEGANGRETLADLFAGRTQLVI